ncbi:MAG: Ig-like domain-containing protein, partial [candidate division WOR-3 bacterium]
MCKIGQAVLLFILITFSTGCSNRESIVEITNPQDGETVNGIVEIKVRVIDGEKISTLGFFIDDSLVKFFEEQPYSYSWNTVPLPDSSIHTIYAKASLEDGNYLYSETISVMVYNILLFYDGFEEYYPGDYPSKYWFQIWPGIGESTYVDSLFSYEGFKSFRICGSSQWV